MAKVTTRDSHADGVDLQLDANGAGRVIPERTLTTIRPAARRDVARTEPSAESGAAALRPERDGGRGREQALAREAGVRDAAALDVLEHDVLTRRIVASTGGATAVSFRVGSCDRRLRLRRRRRGCSRAAV